MAAYAQEIRESLARQGQVGAAEPRLIEAWMRVELGTLDWLSRERFDREVLIALACVQASSPETNEALAATI